MNPMTQKEGALTYNDEVRERNNGKTEITSLLTCDAQLQQSAQEGEAIPAMLSIAKMYRANQITLIAVLANQGSVQVDVEIGAQNYHVALDG